ncbi:MAG TPA: DUF2807 domain-containing protein [Bacteroides sp.]|nr:DUF2807 domain-containing protein [Bacteroides sp.]
MKTILYISLVIIIAAGNSCSISTTESVYGNGKVVTEERSIENFDGLKVSSGIDVLIRQGSGVSLMVEADENLHEVIKTEIVDNTLKIYSTKNIRKSKAKKVYLVYENLNSIRVNSSGNVKGENTLETENLNIDLSSAGDLKLDLQALAVDCDISSAGDARLSGSTNTLNASLSSAGDLYAYELTASKVEVNCSSAGDARVYAKEELKARSSSAGSIYYKGEADVVDARTSSAGSIVRK